MRDFRRPHHRIIGTLLGALNSDFLESSHCYFGGGTCIALLLDEYRESRDVHFLCADTEGFRRLRETVTNESLGKLTRSTLPLAREVRADRDGIRTFIEFNGTVTKLEILHEARIALRAAPKSPFDVPTLDLDCLVAGKLLANADRGTDDSTQARDVIDLAFLAAHYSVRALGAGLELAQSAYGTVILRELRRALERLAKDRRFMTANVSGLGIEDSTPLRKGLAALRSFARRAMLQPRSLRVR
jgi:hypothetical protein